MGREVEHAAVFLPPALAKDPAQGAAAFTTYEGWMSPQQQPGDESDAPKALAKATACRAPSPRCRASNTFNISFEVNPGFFSANMTTGNSVGLLLGYQHL